MLIALERRRDVSLRQLHVAQAEERSAHDVGRRPRRRRASEPILRVGRLPGGEQPLTLDQGAQPQPFARSLRDRRPYLPAPPALHTWYRRAVCPPQPRRHVVAKTACV